MEWIQACSSCPMLVNPFPYTHKANGTCQHQSSGPWAEVHTIEAPVLPMSDAKNAAKPAPPFDTRRPGWNGSRHAAHVPCLSIHFHTPTRQMEHASTNHQVHGQRFTPLRHRYCQ